MRVFKPLIIAMFLCLAADAAGQGNLRDFQYTKDTNPLLGFDNAAALSSFGEGGVSRADASFLKENGALLPLEGSPDSWTASVRTESFLRVSDKLVFGGAMSYSLFMGNQMGGQVLMNPFENPVNFLEEDFSTAGRKKRETYFLTGALSYALNRKSSLGFRVDYTSADQTKYKDPRFQNVLMDLSLLPGFHSRISDRFSLGVNLLFRHSLEQLSAGLYGTVDREYYILVDQGAFMGNRERFDGDVGYVSLNNARPLMNDFYGASLQIVSGARTKLYQQVSFNLNQGYFGSRTSSSVVFCEFSGLEAALDGKLLIPGRNNLHRLEWKAAFHHLSNYTNDYSYKTEDGLSTVVVYNGQNLTLTRNDLSGHLAYVLDCGVRGAVPDWSLSASGDASYQAKTCILFPVSRYQDVFRLNLKLSAVRNITRNHNRFTGSADLLFGAGGGTPKNDTSLGSGTSKAKSFDDYLNRQFEYETAPRAGLALGCTYTRIFSEKFSAYVRLQDGLTALLTAPQYLDGRMRNVATLTVGCTF